METIVGLGLLLLALFQLVQLARGVTVPTRGLLAATNATIAVLAVVIVTTP